MAIPITIPRLGWNMEEGKFAGWLQADGSLVRPGQPLFALESEKSTEEVEAFDSGILHIAQAGPQVGAVLPVGTVIGYLAAENELVPCEVTTASVAGQTPPPLLEQAAHAPARARSQPASSPRARRAATELRVAWQSVHGTGRNGRIIERDVQAAARQTTIPLTQVRRVSAERLVQSHQQAVPVTLTTTVDASNLVNLRRQFQTAEGSYLPSYTDFLVKLTGTALQSHPQLRARWHTDGLRISETIHIGIAVDTPAGLLVPVLRDVPGLALRQVAESSRALIDRARKGILSLPEMQNGTFTVTNLGGFGIDAFTPVINVPECAILGVGRIQRRPAIVGEEIVAREQLTLSLTFDHRIVDGAPAARFLQTLSRLIENPGPALVP